METKQFRSRDFYLSACLMASGQPLSYLIKDGSSFVTFIFDCNTEIAEQIISDHWSRQLVLPTRDLIEAINELKTRLHSSYESNRN